jgi:hypothetical protein
MSTPIRVSREMEELWFAKAVKKTKHLGPVMAMRTKKRGNTRDYLIGSPPLWYEGAVSEDQRKNWEDVSKTALTVQDLGRASEIRSYTKGMFYVEVGNPLVDPFHNQPGAWAERTFKKHDEYPKRNTGLALHKGDNDLLPTDEAPTTSGTNAEQGEEDEDDEAFILIPKITDTSLPQAATEEVTRTASASSGPAPKKSSTRRQLEESEIVDHPVFGRCGPKDKHVNDLNNKLSRYPCSQTWGSPSTCQVWDERFGDGDREDRELMEGWDGEAFGDEVR